MNKIIKFKSLIFQEGKQINQIEFSSRVDIFNFDRFIVFEFLEPSQNISNRIEISKSEINIFAGASTINLFLNKKIAIEYQTQQGIVILDSFLKFINRNDENTEFDFRYSLNNKDYEIGQYHIFLKVS